MWLDDVRTVRGLSVCGDGCGEGHGVREVWAYSLRNGRYRFDVSGHVWASTGGGARKMSIADGVRQGGDGFMYLSGS